MITSIAIYIGLPIVAGLLTLYTVRAILTTEYNRPWLLFVVLAPGVGCLAWWLSWLARRRMDRVSMGLELSASRRRALQRRVEYVERQRAQGIHLGAETLELAGALLELGQPQRVPDLIAEFRERHPGSHPASLILTKALLALGRPREAVLEAQDIVRDAPSYQGWYAMRLLGDGFLALDDPLRARLAWDQILASTFLPEIALSAARASVALREPDDAIARLKVLRERIREAEAHNRRRWQAIDVEAEKLLAALSGR